MKLLLRFFGWMFAVGTVVFLVGIAGAAGLLWHFSKDLPDYSQLQDYEPPVMTRVHATDGSLVAEYAKERRLYLPIQAVPKLVINAFLAAEDKNFYDHGGLDFHGIARAGMLYLQNSAPTAGRRAPPPSPSRSRRTSCSPTRCRFDRKIKEALLALKIERTYSKDKILELYLNEIYLGLGAYGIAAASLIYFDKSVHELTLAGGRLSGGAAEGADQPASVPPARARDRAPQLRDRPHGRGRRTSSTQEGEKAKKEPLNVTPRPTGAHVFAAEYFAEEVRRDLREVRREEALRGRPVGPHHARSEAPGDGAQGADRRPGASSTRRRASAARSPRSTSAATGASSSPR